MSHNPIETNGLPEDDFFGEPISVYTDKQALEDGVLVDLGQFTRVAFLGLPINRMTRHLFDDLKPFLDSDAEGDAKEFGLALGSTLRTKCSFATGDPGEQRRDWRHLPHPAESLACPKRTWRLDRHVPRGLLAAKRERVV